MHTPPAAAPLGAQHRFTALLHAYASGVTRHPWWVLAASLLLVVALSLGMAQLSFRSDSRVFFAQDNADLQALEQFEQTYGRDDTLVFVVSARDGDLFSAARLHAISQLTDAAWHLPQVKRVDSLTNFQRVQALADDIHIDQLLRSGDRLSDNQARDLRQQINDEPLLVGRLLSADARLALVAANLRLDATQGADQAAQAMAAAQALMGRFAAEHPDLHIGLSGSVALDQAFVEASTFDSSVLLPIMVLVLLGIIVLVLRSFAGALATFSVILMSTLAALGTAALLGVPLSSPSVIAPNIILTIACCDCLHLCAGMLRLRGEGLSRREAVREVLVECWWPVTLTTLTTAAGFLSLLFSAVPPFAHLGAIVAIGALLAWLLSLSFLPALMCVLPWQGSTRPAPAQALSLWLARQVLGRPRQALAGVVLAGGVLGAFAFSNTLDDRYVRYFDQRYEFRQATDRLNQALGGFYTLEFSLDAQEAEGIWAPEYLHQTEQFGQWLRQQPGVTHVHGLTDILKTVNRALHGGGAAQFRLPESRDNAAQFLALYEMSLPAGADLKNLVSADKRSSRLSVGLNDMSTAAIAALQASAQAWANEHTPLLAASAKATGTSVLFAHIGNRNIEQMYQGMAVAAVVVWLIFLGAFRSLGLSLVGAVANIVPSLATLGVWALVNGEVGMAVATVASVTFGVVVDDTIHLLTAYARLRRQGLAVEEALHVTFKQVGAGMIAMTLALAGGFACLAFSGFQINAWMGLMASITILIALVFDVLFIPCVLLVCRRRGATQTTSTPT